MRLTRGTIDAHRQLRRRFAAGEIVGPAWTVLISETLWTACDLAGVEPQDILPRLHSSYSWPELRKGPLYAILQRQLPNCTFIRLRSGLLQTKCDGALCYTEERAVPTVALFGRTLPETALTDAAGRRLSELVDTSAIRRPIDHARFRAHNSR